MKIEISELTREKLRNTTFPGQDESQSSFMIDNAINGVVDEFASVARDFDRRQQLYDAVNAPEVAQLDESEYESVLQPARVQLKTIVGNDSDRRLVDQLCTDCDLTEPQAHDVLALVSPTVIEALRSKITDGSVENSPAGISGLLQTENNHDLHSDVDHAIAADTNEPVYEQTDTNEPLYEQADTNEPVYEQADTNEPVYEQAVTNEPVYETADTNEPVYESARSSGVDVNADSGNSWLTKLALPLVLLGALMIGAVKFFSDAQKNRVVVEERGVLQQELAGAQSDLESTQSDLETARGDLETTRGDLESTQAELVALRDVPTDTVTLQESLASVTTERDEAISSGAELQQQLEQVSSERDEALQQGDALQANLDEAGATIAANEESIANIGVLEAELAEMTASRDDALDRNTEYSAANAALQEEVDAIAPKLTDFESQVATLSSERSDLDLELKETYKALDGEKSARTADVDRLTSEVEELSLIHI